MSLKSRVWLTLKDSIEVEGHKFEDLEDIYDVFSGQWKPFKVTYTTEQWRSLQRKASGLRLKYQEAKDCPVLIAFQGRGPFLTPEAFIRDYVEEQFKKLDEACSLLGQIPKALDCGLCGPTTKTYQVLKSLGWDVSYYEQRQ